MRINPPVVSVPRRAVREFRFKGYRYSGRHAGCGQYHLHPSHARNLAWSPLSSIRYALRMQRFAPRHKVCLVPFSGGRICVLACILRTCRPRASSTIC